jgi:hypothetical protein
LGDKLLDEFLLNLIPNSEDPEANNTRAENVREAIRTQYESAPGQDLTGVKGTAWGALNAVTSYTSFEKTVRKETAERRLESVWWGSAAALNKRATDLLLEMA